MVNKTYSITITITIICASDSMFYPLALCALQVVFMIMIIIMIMNKDEYNKVDLLLSLTW